MARLNHVKRFRGTSKTADGTIRCGHCGGTIAKGDPYRWWANRLPGARSGYKQVRCMRPDCRPTMAEMTPGRRGQLMQIQEEGSAQIADARSVEDLQSIAESLAGEVRDLAQELVDGADAMVEGFGHDTYQSDELRERGETLESQAEELESVDLNEYDGSLDDDFDEEAERDDIVKELLSYHTELDEDELDEAEIESRLRQRQEELERDTEESEERHLDEQREKVQEKLDECDVG